MGFLGSVTYDHEPNFAGTEIYVLNCIDEAFVILDLVQAADGADNEFVISDSELLP